MSDPIARASSNLNASYPPSIDTDGGELMCTQPLSARSAEAPPEAPPAVSTLVARHDATNRDCTEELIKLGTASAALAATTAAMIAATPTVIGVLPSTLAFIAGSATLGAAAASYANCENSEVK